MYNKLHFFSCFIYLLINNYKKVIYLARPFGKSFSLRLSFYEIAVKVFLFI